MIVLVVLLTVGCLGLGVMVVVLLRQQKAPEDVLTRRERKQWVLTLKSGDAFRGLLVDHDAVSVVLTSAEHFSDPQSPTPVDGEVVVLLSDLKYAQRL